MMFTFKGFCNARIGFCTRFYKSRGTLHLRCHSHHLAENSGTNQLYGQPAPITHPHILTEGQVTPGLSQQEYKIRRFKLMEAIAQHGLGIENHLIVIPSATKVFMSDKIPYPFRQNTDFLYLSGFQEPDSVLLIHTLPNQNLSQHASVMFVQKRCASIEKWEGPRSGKSGAVELLGVDDAQNFENLEKYLHSFAKKTGQFAVWYDSHGPSFPFLQEIFSNYFASYRPTKVSSPRTLIHQLRLFKSESEAKLMRHSAEVASNAMTTVMQASHSHVEEAHLYAKMDYECRIRGAERLAYPPVVAGGKRANIIHYIANNQRILPKDMVLMDAGCEFHGYASDLTRTWPVSGRFSPPQLELYEALLEVQRELIEQCSIHPSLDQLFHIMCQLLGTKLQELALVSSSANKIEITKMAYEFCPHHVGHFLGMDVHDTTLISRSIPLKSGMVVTIEPGLYIDENLQKIPERFKGLGMRIEDDILITESGLDVLTAKCPKYVEDIEKLVGEAVHGT